MEELLRIYIKDNFGKTASDTMTTHQLLGFIVNLSFSEGFYEGYKEGVESQRTT